MTRTSTSPTQFYTERIPAQFNRCLELHQSQAQESPLVASMEAVNATICVIAEGAGGGRFYLNIAAGRMTAGNAPTHEPFMTLSHDLDSFEVLERESGDSVLGFLAGLAGLQDEMVLTCERAESLAALNGTLLFVLTGEAGFRLLGHFGKCDEGGKIDCTLRFDSRTYAELKKGSLSPQDAFLTGRVEVDGDMEMAIALALAALSTD